MRYEIKKSEDGYAWCVEDEYGRIVQCFMTSIAAEKFCQGLLNLLEECETIDMAEQTRRDYELYHFQK